MKNYFTDKIFMVRPSHFGLNPETLSTNSFQSKITYDNPEVIAEKAKLEFDNAVQKISEAGIVVDVFQDTELPVKPDAVFPNNWVSTHSDGTLITYPMLTPNRQLEVREDIIKHINPKYICDFRNTEGKVLEGTGSVVLDQKNKIIYVSYSERTHVDLVNRLSQKLGFAICGFHAADHQNNLIYHTNVIMFVMNQFVAICLETIKSQEEKEKVKQMIIDSGKEILELTYYQITQFSGNMLQLQRNDNNMILVCSASGWGALDADQKDKIKEVTEVVPIDIPTIELYGGGSARCMIAENFI